MTINSNLPWELIEMIIDFLHGDSRTLAACSLVSRSWLISSHWHMFYQIEVEEEHICKGFLHLLHTSHTVPRSVQELRLVLPTSEPQELIHPQTLIHILELLSSLHTFRIFGIIIGPFKPGVPLRWNHPKLRLLELSGFEAKAEQTIHTMAIFSEIDVEVLRIDQCEIDDALSTNAQQHQALLSGWRVGALYIGDNGAWTNALILSLMKQSILPGSLRALDVIQLNTMVVRGNFMVFLRERGHELRSLRWDVTGMYLRPQDAFWQSLENCTSLQAIHLYLGVDYYYDRFDNIGSLTGSFPAFILQHLPPTVRVITLALGSDYAGSFLRSWIDCVDWPTLEKMLLGAKKLEELRIVLEHPTPALMCDHAVEQIPELHMMDIVKALPALHAAKKLRFPVDAPSLAIPVGG